MAQINMGEDRGAGFASRGQDSAALTRPGFGSGLSSSSAGDDDGGNPFANAAASAPIIIGGIDLDADDDGGDNLTFEAIQLVKSSGKASASLLQRHLKIGYARAARLLDILEEKGVVGPVDGAKARKVYVE